MAASNDDNGVQGLESIPGIGLIRVRSLKKAGWGSLDSLAGVSEEELAAVPGIGAIKARHIKEFVSGLQAARIADGPQYSNDQVVISERVSAPDDAESELAARLQESLSRITALASEILSRPSAADLNRSLARQLGRVATLRPAILKPKRARKALTCLEKLASILASIPPDHLPRKQQDRLSDELRDRRKKLDSAMSQKASRSSA